MSAAAPHPDFRLTGFDGPAEREAWAAQQQARLEIIKENRIAAARAPGLDPSDPRWILAMQTQARLQGAVLTPERREQLLASGRKLGLRPFEANLVIAIVQDRARCGKSESLKAAQPAMRLVAASLERDQKISAGAGATRAGRRDASWPKWLAALAAAAAAAALVLRWLSHPAGM